RRKHTVPNARRPAGGEQGGGEPPRARGGLGGSSPRDNTDTRHQPMPVVAVTGAAHGIGRALTLRLAASPGVKKVIAIDTDRGDITGVTWRVADVRDPALAGRLAGADIV